MVAEKLQAIALLGIANSRMKDYFDLWILSRHSEFEGDILSQAIRATFDRRMTRLPPEAPFGLTESFAQDAQKQTQWQAFVRRNRLEAPHLTDVVAALRNFLLPVIAAANKETGYRQHWPAGGPWSSGTYPGTAAAGTLAKYPS